MKTISGNYNKPRRNRGIEVSYWKVGDADGFQALDTRRGTAVEQALDFDPSPELLGEVKDWYKSRTGEDFPEHEAEEAIRNMVGFVETLHEWDIDNKQKKSENPT